MSKVFSLICYILIAFFLSGCLLADDSKESEDNGSYSLISNKIQIDSFPEGGGLFILSMEPSEDFEGEIHLSIEADQKLNAILYEKSLSITKYVSEVEFYPDSTIAFGTFPINIISRHGGIKESLMLSVEIHDPIYPNGPSTPYPPQKFVAWLNEGYPGMGISPGIKWIYYRNEPIITMPGSSLEQTWLNQSWEMTVYTKGPYPYKSWYLLRKRGEVLPVFAAKRENLNYNAHYEIDVAEYKK